MPITEQTFFQVGAMAALKVRAGVFTAKSDGLIPWRKVRAILNALVFLPVVPSTCLLHDIQTEMFLIIKAVEDL